jgi:signal-transduction protein with cAMP-binding, CBS, and nucleotidyltransferase domain
MISIFKKYIQDSLSVADDAWEFIAPLLRTQSFNKGDQILTAGQYWQSHAFILKGCVSTFKMNETDHKEIISFDCETAWIGDGEALASGLPSRFNIEAIEDTHLLLIKNTDFDLIRNNLKAFHNYVESVRYGKFINSNKKIHAAFARTAIGRYRNFLNQYPKLVLRLPENLIASYLSINTETLNSVRREFSKGKRKPLL